MSFEITDHVPGVSDDRVAAIQAEAERGYDLRDARPEANPHAAATRLVPEDLLDAIQDRARRDGESPEAVVRHALDAYLRSA